jgi:glycosyltransferase involved in cell wall biosynthesis
MALAALSRFRLLGVHFFTAYGTELLRYRRETFPRLWMHNAFARVTAVAAISAYVRDLLLRHFPVRAERVFVSHPGIADHWFTTPGAEVSAVRARWGLAPDDFVVLTVARRVRDKGHEGVIAGLAELPAALRRRCVYVVAGDGPEDYARALASQAESRGVRILLLGSVPDRVLVEACDAADLFVMLSRETPRRLEGLGLTYIEAGARGLPSLACRTGGVPEAVRDGETGIVLPGAAGAAQVAESLKVLVEDRELRARMGQRAREFAAGFTWKRHASEVYARFDDALAARRAR